MTSQSNQPATRPETAIRVIFAGSGEFGRPALEAIKGAGHEIVQVISQPDRPAGRGKHLTPTPISMFCTQHGLPLTRTDDINALPLTPADLLVVIAFGQKIGQDVIERFPLRAINLHASRLPKYRGAAPINWAIISGERETGNSVIRLAQKMDAGEILGMSSITIEPTETAGELHDRLAVDGATLVSRVITDLAAGRAQGVEQDHSAATLARKLSRESCRFDWHRPAREIARLVRGTYPWPGCRARLMDGEQEVARLTLVRATHDDSGADVPARAGEILPDYTVAADTGRLVVLEVQPEGKRPMSRSAYRNGHRWAAGMWMESIA